jgi:SAM-dependent methyltransferase
MTTWTEDPRTVATYDVECLGRRDHDLYLALAQELGAGTVVDVGCGTGVLAVAFARLGMAAIGVDPAAAMIEAARERSGGDLVAWVHGTVADVSRTDADLVVMTGHVAQYFVTEDAWREVLTQCRRVLRDGGVLAFEVRQPDRGWAQRWTRERTERTLPHPDGGTFTSWGEVVDVDGDADSFTQTHVGHTLLPDGTRISHPETLRFRSEAEVRESLAAAGFRVDQIWGDWDRSPVTADNDELIVVARAS